MVIFTHRRPHSKRLSDGRYLLRTPTLGLITRPLKAEGGLPVDKWMECVTHIPEELVPSGGDEMVAVALDGVEEGLAG